MVVRVFNQVIDWTVYVWRLVKDWVIEQGSQIARAFSFWSKEPVAQAPASVPKVLGEEADHPLAPSLVKEGELPASPLTYKTELAAPSFAKASEGRRAPVEAILPPASTLPEPPPASSAGQALGKEGIPSEPTPAPAEIIPSQPQTTPELLPAPEATSQPEEPKKQSSSYFIPILARDFVPPTSKVSALATTTLSNVFTVSWTGEDTDVTGSPLVKDYDIQYQVDSGAWTDWLLETTLLSSLFTTPTSIEKIYGFRSRARDRYGNLGTYPASADTSIYVNLLVPNLTVDTPAPGSTLLSTTADENPATGDVEVTISGTGDTGDIISVTLGGTTATTTVAAAVWSKQVVLAEGANNFTIQAQETDGDTTTISSYALTLELVPTHDVVINEIAWMGTSVSTADEWIELYNPTNAAIDMTGWTILSADSTPNPNITLSGTIAAKSYFLMERTNDTTIFDITADFVYPGINPSNQMSNTGELLTLRKANGSLVDKVGTSTPNWFAGDNTTKSTMERKDPTGDGTLASNWATNDGVLINGKASDNATNIKGTPKSLNSQNTTIPRVVTNLQQQWIYTTTTSVRLYWTAPKNADSTATTTPPSYDLRYSGSPITEGNFDLATSIAVLLAPSAIEGTIATSTVSGLTASTTYYFAIKTNNGAETSGLSNVYKGNTYDTGYTTLSFPASTVSSNTTIATSTRPYLVSTNFAVAAGVTLTINPGVVIKMNTSGSQRGCNTSSLSCAITVSGSLVLGSGSDSINAAVITSTKDDTYAGDANGDGASSGGAGDWDKLATSGGASSITINHGIVRYGGYGSAMMQMMAGNASITNSIMELSSGYAITLINDATALTMATSTIQNNAEGIGISNQADANIQGSTFTGNHRGIAINSSADELHLIIRNNNFFANNTVFGGTPFAGIHYSDTTGTLTAENNWWGSASGPTTISPDSDATRDAAMADTTAVIDYTPFATSAFTILPSGL